jgi:hypothetical protein
MKKDDLGLLKGELGIWQRIEICPAESRPFSKPPRLSGKAYPF